MQARANAISVLFAALLISAPTQAQENAAADRPVRLDDGYGDAFVNYKPYIIEEKKPKKKDEQTPPASRKSADEPKDGREVVNVDWLRKHLPELEKRAIDNPTKVNVEAFLYAQRIGLDKAQRYNEMRTQVVNTDPILNENNRIPYASTGALSIRNANYQAQQQAAKELAETGGLIVFIDSTCRFCAQQMPIIASLKHAVGLEALVVSTDGKAPKGFKGQFVRDNGLFKKLGLKLTPSIVYVPRPKAYAGEIDPNQYLIIAQGFYAQDELVKQIAYAGHTTKLLSAETMKDLDVWDRGVASTADLNALRLDSTKPETFRSTVEPILLKQY